MKTVLKIFNGLVTAKDDRLLYNGMNSNNNNVILRVLAGEERCDSESYVNGKRDVS